MALFAAIASVSRAHVLMTGIYGANGGNMLSCTRLSLIVVANRPCGVDPSTPRYDTILPDGSENQNTTVDTSVFVDGDLMSGLPIPHGCGSTEQSGVLNCSACAVTQVRAAGNRIPTSNNGTLHLQVFQVNHDGAGPLVAFVDPTGTGTQFHKVQVTPCHFCRPNYDRYL